MSAVVNANVVSLREYEEAFADLPVREGVSLFQSPYWARVMDSFERCRPLPFVFSRDGQVLGLQLGVIRTPLGGVAIGLAKQLGLPVDSLMVDGGPILADSATRSEVMAAFLGALDKACAQRRVVRVSYLRASGNDEVESLLTDHGFRRGIWATYIVDLAPAEEDLFKNLDYSTHKNIKRCQRAGVTVRRLQSYQEYMHLCYPAYRKTLELAGKDIFPPRHMQIQLEQDSEDIQHRFVALDQDGNVLAGLGLNIYQGMAAEVESFVSVEAKDRKLHAGDLLHWEVIRFCKSRSCAAFDLSGVNPNPLTEKERNIKRYKEKWGGRLVTYPVYSKECTGLAVSAVRSLRGAAVWLSRRRAS